jgi:hypothetical protein
VIGAQCDGPKCRRFGPAPNARWFYIAQNGEMVPLFGQGATMLAVCCSLTCVADFAYAQAMVTGPATGTEPPPPGPPGTGWPT